MSPHTRLAPRAFWQVSGLKLAPEARRRMLDDWTLNNYYYDEAYIAYRRHAARHRGPTATLGVAVLRGVNQVSRLQSDWWEIPT